MVIRALIFVVILLNTIYVFGINNYDLIEVKKIKTGAKENELGYENSKLPEFGIISPTWFIITDKNLIYIIDVINDGIKIFDINFNFKSIITDNEQQNVPIRLFNHFKVDSSGNIIGYHPYVYLLKVDINGKIIFKKNINFPSLIGGISGAHNYYPIDNYTFYYDDLNKIYCILPDGEKANNNETMKKLTEIQEKDTGILLNNKELKEIIRVFLKNKKLLFSNDRLYINNSFIYNQYFDLIRANIKSIKLKDRIRIDKDYAMQNLLGFDSHNNSYWKGIKSNSDGTITVFSKYGEVLDYFFIPYSSNPPGTIAPNGDVYYWNNADKDYVIFYKTRNVWDPIDSPDTAQSTEPVVTSLTASSYNPYKNMYTPLKAFDGDIKTAWLEAAKGPGIGESITLELDREITIDSIQVLPGYFDTKWWKSNNRVKSLIMKTDDSTTTLQFQDAMKPHKADFKEPKTFKKVEFIIKEVYPSGKDDDTAISEIQFYYKGERIQLDFSKQEVE